MCCHTTPSCFHRFGTAVRIRDRERRFAGSGERDDGRGRQWAEQRTPVIALSAFHSEEYRNRCRESGMDDYLCKPVKKDALVSCLAKWCDDPRALRRSACTIANSDCDGGAERDEEELTSLAGGSGVPFPCLRTW
jgi:hypothetical protein